MVRNTLIYKKLTEVPKEDEWSSGTSGEGRYVIVVDNNKVMRLNANEITGLADSYATKEYVDQKLDSIIRAEEVLF